MTDSKPNTESTPTPDVTPASTPKPPISPPITRKPTRLGRGLSALMAQPVQVTPSDPSSHGNIASLTAMGSTPQPSRTTLASGAGQIAETASSQASDQIYYLPVDQIKPNPHQPRQHFSEEALKRLADSISSDGLIQPIIVRHTRQSGQSPALPGQPDPGRHAYELVAGERRLRAAKIAGLKQLPAIVRSLGDRQIAEWALIENLQREDLNPIERAQAFERLIEQFHLSHDQIAQRVGSDRSTISNSLRLLKLCDPVREFVRDGLISGGQAKALAGISDPPQQEAVAKQALAKGWSVRQVEHEVRRVASTEGKALTTQPAARSSTTAAHLLDLEQKVGQQLQTKVKIRSGRKKGSGKLTIDFYSLDQFDSLMEKLGVRME